MMSIDIEKTTNELRELSDQLTKEKMPHLFLVAQCNGNFSIQFSGTGDDFLQLVCNAIDQIAEDAGVPANTLVKAIASGFDCKVSSKGSTENQFTVTFFRGF